MKLTEHFTLEEMTVSATAKRRGIDNTPNGEIQEHLLELCTYLLEPLRAAWGKPIHINSGYRSLKLNTAINGSATSAHVYGWAADCYSPGTPIKDFKAFVKEWLHTSRTPYDQYIDEHSGSSEWVHLGIRNRQGRQRYQNLLYKGGKYTIAK